VAKYEQALRTLHFEAWPNATQAQKDCDLKRRFEEGLSSQDMFSYLRLHTGQDTFAETVKKARQFKTLTQKKSVKSATTDTVTINTLQLGNVGDVLDSIRTTVREEMGQQHGPGQFVKARRQNFSHMPQHMNTPALPAAGVGGCISQNGPPNNQPYNSGTPVPRFYRRHRFNQFGENYTVNAGYPVFSVPAENTFMPLFQNVMRSQSVPSNSRRIRNSGCWECGTFG